MRVCARFLMVPSEIQQLKIRNESNQDLGLEPGVPATFLSSSGTVWLCPRLPSRSEHALKIHMEYEPLC